MLSQACDALVDTRIRLGAMHAPFSITSATSEEGSYISKCVSLWYSLTMEPPGAWLILLL